MILFRVDHYLSSKYIELLTAFLLLTKIFIIKKSNIKS